MKQNIFTQLSTKYNLPQQVIEVICKHPFLFASRSIANEEDERSLMFAYLGKLKIKKKYENNKNKQQAD